MIDFDVVCGIALILLGLGAIGAILELFAGAWIMLSGASAVRKVKLEQKKLDSRTPEQIAIDEVWK